MRWCRGVRGEEAAGKGVLIPACWLRLFTFLALTGCACTFTLQAQEELETVRVDGRPVLQVGGTTELPAQERARQIERRVDRLLRSATAIEPARVIPSPTNATARVISVSGVPLVTVSEEDAQDQLSSVEVLAGRWAAALDRAIERGRERRANRWATFRTEVQGSIVTAFSRLVESAIRIVPRAMAALLVIGLFWLLASLVRWAMRQLFRRIVKDLTIENLIKQVSYYTVWALGFILAADAFGLQPGTVVTGLGLTSLALGFALKDILSNFVSGILILGLRPFELGDQIVVGDTEGAVERIQLRATQIRTYDGRAILVPNAEVFTSRITNNTESPIRRGAVRVFIGYGEDLRNVAEVIRAATTATEGVLETPPVGVRVQELGASDILLEARFWTDSRRSDYVATSSAVRDRIVRELKNAGIGLPKPDVRRVIWENGNAGGGAQAS